MPADISQFSDREVLDEAMRRAMSTPDLFSNSLQVGYIPVKIEVNKLTVNLFIHQDQMPKLLSALGILNVR